MLGVCIIVNFCGYVCAGVKLFSFITIWCLLIVMPVNMTVSANNIALV
jgi:hypothetical protein